MKIIEIKYCYVNTRFQGIYQKRMSSQNKKLEKNASKFDVKRLADESKKQIDQFLLSEEGKKWLASRSEDENHSFQEMLDEGRIIALKDGTLYQFSEENFSCRTQDDDWDDFVADKVKNNPFWEHNGEQWLTFTSYLDKNGFYDSMSDSEVKDFENLLRDVTKGVSKAGNLYLYTENGTPDAYSMWKNKAEGILAIESSSQALYRIADKMLPQNIKEGFYKLIEQYKSHNEELMDTGYRNPIDSMARGVGMLCRRSGDTFGTPIKSEKAKLEDLRKELFSGKKAESYESYRQEIIKIFQNIGKTSNSFNFIQSLKESYLSFSTNGSTDSSFQNYMMKDAKDTFSFIQQCWEKTMLNYL